MPRKEHVNDNRARSIQNESGSRTCTSPGNPGNYGPFDVASYFLHDVDAEIAAECEPYQRSEADIAFELVCDFQAWPPLRIRVLVGADDRFFPAGFQRRVARDRIGVEADVIPGGHLLPLAQPRLVADCLLQTTRP